MATFAGSRIWGDLPLSVRLTYIPMGGFVALWPGRATFAGCRIWGDLPLFVRLTYIPMGGYVDEDSETIHSLRGAFASSLAVEL